MPHGLQHLKPILKSWKSSKISSLLKVIHHCLRKKFLASLHSHTLDPHVSSTCFKYISENPRLRPVCSCMVIQCLLLRMCSRAVPLHCSAWTMVEMQSIIPFLMGSCKHPAGQSCPLPHHIIPLMSALQLTQEPSSSPVVPPIRHTASPVGRHAASLIALLPAHCRSLCIIIT